MTKDLSVLREELETNYLSLFQVMQERRGIVQNIQKSKTHEFYCVSREISLFESLKDKLLTLSQKELFALSLLIESHAQQENTNYPSFSLGEHLITHPPKSLIHQTNPNLLLVTNKSLYDKLNLKEDFINECYCD